VGLFERVPPQPLAAPRAAANPKTLQLVAPGVADQPYRLLQLRIFTRSEDGNLHRILFTHNFAGYPTARGEELHVELGVDAPEGEA